MAATKIQLDPASRNDGWPKMETLLDGRQGKSARGNDWAIRSGRFSSGLSSGVELLELCNGPLSVYVLPTRGMGIWKARCGDVTLGWRGPTPGPVHPKFVNLQGRNGLGWLDGFDELICRCGLAFNGPPGHDDGARSPIESDITLHGRIANIPARNVELFVDDQQEIAGVTGIVEECAMFGPQLRMRSTISSRFGSTAFTIRDEITNLGAEPTEMQLLYHANIGRPFLDEGATVECPARQIVPRDGRAAEGVKEHQVCQGPRTGYAEQVYYYDLICPEGGETLALLRNRAGDKGVSVHFQKSQLPCFSVWKCTQAEQAGYVTGLEPATNFPNFKGFERHHGRVVQLAPEQTYVSEVRMEMHLSAAAVSAVSGAIRKLQGDASPQVHVRPATPFCPID